MLFCIDIGNTHSVLGVFQGNDLVAHWRVHTNRDLTGDELGVLITNLFAQSPVPMGALEGVIISSVVPPLNNTYVRLCRRSLHMEPLFVGPNLDVGMPVLYDNPLEVGADRIVNSVAAYHAYPTDLIVVDFGTATTFDCVSKAGEYLGGAICPGAGISMEALFQRASKLPRVEMFKKPKAVVAKDTMNSMNAGIVFGYAGLVDGLVEAIEAERGVKCKVLGTGGLANLIAGYSKSIEDVDDLLTLKGLRIIYERCK